AADAAAARRCRHVRAALRARRRSHPRRGHVQVRRRSRHAVARRLLRRVARDPAVVRARAAAAPPRRLPGALMPAAADARDAELRALVTSGAHDAATEQTIRAYGPE